MSEKGTITVKQIAEHLEMDEHAVCTLAPSGQSPPIVTAGLSGLKKDVIDKWIKECILRNLNTAQNQSINAK